MVGGRRPLVEDYLKQGKKMRFCMLTILTKVLWLMEDDLLWKTTFGGRQPSVEDDPRWKMTFGGRRPLEEDNLQCKMTFGGRQSSVGGDLWLKAIFCGR